MRSLITRVCLPLGLCGLLFAQSPSGNPAFEVALIRPVPGAPMQMMQAGRAYINIDDSHVNIGSLPLSSIIQIAFRIPDDQIVEPDWTSDLRFDIQATIPRGATKEQVPEMVQTLLVERFKLTFHRDEKVFPVYALTVAKDGPKFHESPEEDQSQWGCNGGFHKACRHISMEDFARQLSMATRMAVKNPAFANVPDALDRRVVDMTGLTGVYDFELISGRPGGHGAGGRGTSDAPIPTSDSETVSVFDAVKTLGLNLVPTKHTYEIVVVDRVERVPTEN